MFFFFSSRRRHTRFDCDWSSDVCSSDLTALGSSVAHPAIKARQQKMTVLMTTGPCPNQPAAPRAPATLAPGPLSPAAATTRARPARARAAVHTSGSSCVKFHTALAAGDLRPVAIHDGRDHGRSVL